MTLLCNCSGQPAMSTAENINTSISREKLYSLASPGSQKCPLAQKTASTGGNRPARAGDYTEPAMKTPSQNSNF